LISVPCTVVFQDIVLDAGTDLPVKKNQCGINRLGDLLSGLADEELKVGEECCGIH
jgi:hypothetical protein